MKLFSTQLEEQLLSAVQKLGWVCIALLEEMLHALIQKIRFICGRNRTRKSPTQRLPYVVLPISVRFYALTPQ
jgi:hypothetical protein